MNGNTPDQEEQLEFFMDDIVTAICLRNGDAYAKAEIIKKAADKYYAQQPSSQAIEGWWICTDFLSKGGQKVMGPFVSRDYAFAARTQLEKLNAPVTYWIDSLTAPDETGREA